MKSKVKIFINIVIISVIGVCLLLIGIKEYGYYKAKKGYEQIKDIYYGEDIDEKTESEKLKDINSDYKFWINIPGTVIDYPVVQTTDNEYYLKNDFYKEESKNGTIFIDYDNDIENDKNIILYGHHMRDKSMFAEINKFKEEEFFNSGTIKINNNGKEDIYKVFSVYVAHGNANNIKTTFNNDDEFKEYIDFLKEQSFYNNDIESNKISKMLTLYTCSYEFDEARTIVSAYLVE